MFDLINCTSKIDRFLLSFAGELVKDFHLDSPRLTRSNQGRLQKLYNGQKAMPRKPSNHDSQLDRHHYVQESVTDQGQEGNSSTGPTPGLSQWFIINPLMIGELLFAYGYFMSSISRSPEPPPGAKAL